MKRPLLLDCTLRDGGYYTRWDFAEPLARHLLASLDQAGVDIVELGYRSRAGDGFYGLFRYCDEELVSRLLPADRKIQLAFMIDAKSFLADGRVDEDALAAAVGPASGSVFDWCRIATHPHTVAQSAEMAALLHRWGYRVALNIMGISTLEGERLAETVAAASGAPIDVLYLADSYGSLTPTTTLEKIAALRACWSGPVGVHMHENQGLALANTMAAVDEGVEFVDATVSGMGRGAGNLRLEQLLLWLQQTGRRTDLDPGALLPVLQEHFLPMKRAFGWGWDFSYMLSGLVEIHPTYCQELKAGSRYDLADVAAILQAIPREHRSRYRPEVLLAAENAYIEARRPADEREVEALYEPVPADEVLIVANGPHLRRHAEAVRQFIARRAPSVLECNHTGVLDGIRRTTVVMNPVRMEELVRACPGDPTRALITGLTRVPRALDEEPARVAYTLDVGQFDPTPGRIVLPAYVVGMLAVAVALGSRPERIYLVGFDGFDDPARRAEQNEMETFWSLARKAAPDVELVSLTPTHYSLPVRSLYGLLGSPR